MFLAVLLLSTALFIAALLVRNVLFHRICAICLSICGSWITLLTLYKLNLFHNQLVIGLLLGQSVTGIFYLIRRQVPRSLWVFTLPFFLSLTTLAYWTVGETVSVWPVLGFLTLLWVIAYVLFVSARDKGGKVAEAVITCCGDK